MKLLLIMLLALMPSAAWSAAKKTPTPSSRATLADMLGGNPDDSGSDSDTAENFTLAGSGSGTGSGVHAMPTISTACGGAGGDNKHFPPAFLSPSAAVSQKLRPPPARQKEKPLAHKAAAVRAERAPISHVSMSSFEWADELGTAMAIFKAHACNTTTTQAHALAPKTTPMLLTEILTGSPTGKGLKQDGQREKAEDKLTKILIGLAANQIWNKRLGTDLITAKTLTDIERTIYARATKLPLESKALLLDYLKTLRGCRSQETNIKGGKKYLTDTDSEHTVTVNYIRNLLDNPVLLPSTSASPCAAEAPKAAWHLLPSSASSATQTPPRELIVQTFVSPAKTRCVQTTTQPHSSPKQFKNSTDIHAALKQAAEHTEKKTPAEWAALARTITDIGKNDGAILIHGVLLGVRVAERLDKVTEQNLGCSDLGHLTSMPTILHAISHGTIYAILSSKPGTPLKLGVSCISSGSRSVTNSSTKICTPVTIGKSSDNEFVFNFGNMEDKIASPSKLYHATMQAANKGKVYQNVLGKINKSDGAWSNDSGIFTFKFTDDGRSRFLLIAQNKAHEINVRNAILAIISPESMSKSTPSPTHKAPIHPDKIASHTRVAIMSPDDSKARGCGDLGPLRFPALLGTFSPPPGPADRLFVFNEDKELTSVVNFSTTQDPTSPAPAAAAAAAALELAPEPLLMLKDAPATK